jgi:hypothetical protein
MLVICSAGAWLVTLPVLGTAESVTVLIFNIYHQLPFVFWGLRGFV